MSRGRGAPVAVVGMSARLPGADGLESFWELLIQGREGVGAIPPERWESAGVRAAGLPAWRAGLIPEVERFDAALFGISPREAALMDPQQRLVLELAWHALEDALIAPDRLRGSATGVFLGLCGWDYSRLLLRHPEALDGHAVTGTALSIAANRVSYLLGLEGPSLVVDTACSSSLVALHLACQSLRAGECDLALCGGVNLLLDPQPFHALSRAGMLAPDGRCKVFAATADGYVRGEGGGMLVLQRWDEAKAAGMPVRAVILGSALNQDGASNGLTAPNPQAQAALLRAAYAAAGVEPGRVDYVEAHGTGTRLGDPIECRALAEVLGQERPRERPLAVGSVKSNLGHLEAAAGVAGVLKTVLALERGAIPPTLHCAELNPLIPFAQQALRPQTAAGPWPRYLDLPVAGVSSFSFGGSNAHVVLQAVPAAAPAPEPSPDPLRVLCLSAATEEALRSQAGRLAHHLSAVAEPGLDTVAGELRRSRARLRHRLALVAGEPAAVAAELEAFARGGRVAAAHGAAALADRRPRLVMLFAGQGELPAGLAAGLYAESPAFRAALDACAAVAEGDLGLPLRQWLLDAGPLRETAQVQTALAAFQIALAAHWRSWGIVPDAVCGHSAGEMAAACVAGALTLEEAVRLAAQRGRLMQALPPGGAMLAVRAAEERLRELIGPEGTVEIAAVNSPRDCTLAGGREELARLAARLEAAGIAARPLAAAHAFHSARVEPALPALEQAAREVAWQPLRIPFASGPDGALLDPGTVLEAAWWRRQARRPVRFAAGLQALLAAGYRLFLEIGPGAELSRFGQRLGGPSETLWAASLDGGSGVEAARRALARLWVRGVEAAVPAAPGGRTRLPLYAFDRRRHWLPSGPLEELREAPPEASPRPPAEGSVLAALTGDIAALLQCSPEEIDPAVPFLEMGADSIVMIDAVRHLERRFGVKVQIARLFEDLSTLRDLAAFLEEQTGAAPEAAATAAEMKAPAPPAAAPAPTALPQVERILPSFRRAEAARAHLSERQRAHLDLLTRRFNARTGGSKDLAERFRPVLADPRAAAGFRLTTKEMLYPIVGAGASGARLLDVDGNEYLDLTMGFGVHLFGHRPPFVQQALARQLEAGWELGPRAAAAGLVAERLAALTGVERVAFCNSGTEVVMTALRLARTVTRRNKVALFSGSYHGHSDGTLAVDAGGAAVPAVPGVTPGAVADLLVLPYGEEESLAVLRREAPSLAAVLVEPVQSRRPDLQPREFLAEVRRITAGAGTALIFDEMITGFRIAAGGAQAWFGVRADLVLYGKIVGGGLPIGVVAGRADFMNALDGGPWRYGDESHPAAETTFLAGTFCQHPLAMAAAAAVLAEIAGRGPALYEQLNARSERLAAQLAVLLEREQAPLRVARFGSLFRFQFRDNMDLFFLHLLARGLYVWEGRNCFLSTAHDDADLDRVVAAVEETLIEMREGGFLPVRRPAAAPEGGERLPLSDAQRQIAALALVSPAGKRAYNISIGLELEGDLDPEALAGALRDLVARHSALRTVLLPDGEGQRALPSWAPPLLRTDLAGAPAAALEERLAEAAGRDFDLIAAPPFAAELLRLAERHHLLHLTVHHLVCDGFSLGILVGELSALYAARRDGAPAALAPARQYAEQVRWHEEHREGPALRAAEDYWRQALAGAPLEVELPCDRPRPPRRSFVGGSCKRLLAAGPAAALARTAAAHGCTRLMILLAGFAALLERWSGADDLLIGLAVADRPLEGSLVGHCTNLLPIRLRPRPTQPAGAFLREVRGTVLAAVAHGSYPFARMLDRLLPRRDPGVPAVPVSFNLDRQLPTPGFAGLAARRVPVPSGGAHFDLVLNATELDGQLLLEAEYDAELFDAATVEVLLASYEALLAGLAERPETPLEDLPLTPPAVADPPAPAVEIIAPGGTLGDRLARWVAADPARPALDGPAGQVTYGELDAETNRLACALRRRGIDLETRVGVIAGRDPGSVLALLAVLKAGGAYVPIDCTAPAARAERIAAESGCRLVLAAAPGAGLLAGALPLDVLRGEAAGESAETPAVRSFPESLAYVLYTSGSTGAPKGVGIEHRQLVSYLDALAGRLGLEPGARCAALCSLQVDLFQTALLPALFLGGSLVLVPGEEATDPAAVARCFASWPVDLLKIAPAHLGGLLAGPAGAAVLPRRWLVIAGEALPPELVARVRSLAPGLRVINAYGPTETTVNVTAYEIDGELDGRVPIGRALANSRMAVVDRRGLPLPAGFVGEIVAAGAGVGRGYHGLPGATAEAFRPDPESALPGGRRYHTGDLGRFRADGEIDFLGRRDEQVKIRGHRIEPAEVAAALRSLAGVGEAVVVVARRAAGEAPRLIAYATRAGGPPLTEEDVLRELRVLLPEPMIPAALLFLPALPLTPTGKVDRRALPPPPAPQASSPAAAPRSDAEARLLEIWRALLPQGRFGVTDDLVSLGADSVMAMQASGRAAAAGLRIAPAQVFAVRTIAAMAVAARPAGEASRRETGAAGETFPPAPQQLRLLEEGRARPQHWNLSLLLAAPPAPSPAVLARVAQAVVGHHDALRSRFRREADGSWRARVASGDEAAAGCVCDLSGLEDEAAAGELARGAAAVQTSLDLTRGPLVRLVLFGRGAGRPSRLLAVAHHLVVDGVSWAILLADLNAAWTAESAGQRWQPPAASSSFAAWAAGEARRAAADPAALMAEAEAWRAALDGAEAGLPLDGSGDDREGDARVLPLALGAADTAALLRGLSSAGDAGPLEALLAALAASLAPWTGRHRLLVEVERHGREDAELDLSRTAGFFTAQFPVWLDLTVCRGPLERLAAVGERLRSLPGAGLGFGRLRWSSPEAVRGAMARLPEPAVCVNYLGSGEGLTPEGAPLVPVGGTGVVDLGCGPEIDPAARRRHHLALDAMLRGGRLWIDLTWPGRLLAEGTATALGERLLAGLRELAAALAGGAAVEDADAVEDRYALSPLQEGMLFHSLAAPGAGIYVDQQLCRLEGGLDRRAFARAWNDTLAAHPALRAAFLARDDEAPSQVILRHLQLPVHEIDGRALPRERREDLLREALAADVAGFDLARPPLMRLRLLRTDDLRWQMLWTHHHLILDGWSSALLVREVLERYREGLHGRGSQRPAPPPPRQFVEWLARQSREDGERFWRESLAGLSGPGPLPLADGHHGRPEMAQTARRLSPAAAAALEALARRHGVTLATLAEAAWALLLARYGGTPDVVIGLTVAVRPADLEGAAAMIGNFINVLPLRLRCDEDLPLGDWLGRVQQAAVGALAHAHDALTDVRRWAGLPPHQPLFHTALVFENYPQEPLEGVEIAPGLRIAELRSIERSDLPLTLTVERGANGLLLQLAYDRAVCGDASCERLLAHLEGVLRDLPGPARRVGDLRLEPDAAPRRPAAPPPQAAPLLPEIFARRVAAAPAAVALAGAEWEMTYEQLDKFSNRLANVLLGPADADTPGFVALLLDSGSDVVALMLAALKTGHPFLCLDPGAPPARLRRILEETRPALLVAERGHLSRHAAALRGLAETIGCRVAGLPLEEGSDEPPAVELSAATPAYAVYTSGSTGRPKGMVHTQGALAQIVDWHVREFRVGPGSRVAQWAVPSYDAAYGEIFTALAAGATLCPIAPEVRLDPARTAHWLREERVTLFQTVPSYLQRMLAEFSDGQALGGLDCLLCAGEPLAAELARRARAALPPGAALYNLYGPSECFLATWHRVEEVGAGPAPVPIGEEIPGREALVLDAAGRPCPAGVTGEVFLRSPFLCPGYLERAEETALRFVPDPALPGGRLFRTGDLARRRADGALELLGRDDEQVKLRGMRVELAEIAAVLSRHPGLCEAVAVLQTFAAAGEAPERAAVVAYAVARDGALPPDPEELRGWATQELPPHMVPATVLLLPRLPRLANGKLDRASLPAPRPPEEPAGGGPATPLEQMLAGLWGDLLGTPPPGRRADFFALGGDSLLAGRMVNALRARGFAGLPVRRVLETPVLADLAGALERSGPEQIEAIARLLDYVESLADEDLPALATETPAARR